MSHFALADALTDFGATPLHPADPFPIGMGEQHPPEADFPALPETIVPEPVDIDALIAEAVTQAEARITQQLADEHAQALGVLQEQHQEEITALEHRFADAASEKIMARFSELEQSVIESTGAVVARILGTIISDDIRERSLERLAALIHAALADGEAVRIRLHGSLPLFEALKERLPQFVDQLDFSERPDFDLSLSIDGSLYETRIAEWSAVLAGTLS